MAWTLNLYKCSDDPRIVAKNVGTVQASVSCTPYEPISDTDGYVIIEYNATRQECNYAELNGKYYYVTGREMLTGQRIRISLHVDVLMSKWSSFKEAYGIVRQNADPDEDKMNAYMSNSAVKISADPLIYSFNIGSAFVYDADRIVLCAIGASGARKSILPINN